MRRYKVTLTGRKPLLMHSDDIGCSEQVKAWQKAPENRGLSVAGDDRSPAWTWIAGVYRDEDAGVLAIPSDNLMTMIREGGSLVVVKGSKTFKAQTQSGILCEDLYWPLLVGGKTISWARVKDLWGEMDFEAHQTVAAELGFSLLMKRARIGQAKHVRVRALFSRWSAVGTLLVLDDQITTEILRTILEQAGIYKGLCDWRPSSKTPGQFGTFSAEVEEV